MEKYLIAKEHNHAPVRLLCDRAEKKKILRACKFSNRFVRLSYIFAPVLVLLAGAGTLLTGLYSDSAFLVTDPGKASLGQKDYFSMGLATVLLTLTLVLLFWFYTILLDKIYGQNISERINETVDIDGDMLVYGYQNRVGHTDRDRVIVKIHLDGFTDICYTEETSKLVFRGKISSRYYRDYLSQRNKTAEEYFIDEFVIYDYFSPGVCTFFAVTAEAWTRSGKTV